MSSSFAGLDLFGSGPHRFVIKPVGMLFLPPLTADALQITTDVVTQLELAIVQRGRLVADTDADLWAQVDLIQQKAEIPLNGVLVDHSGRNWTNMTLLRFAPEDRVDRGRKVSLAYRVDYIRLAP